MVSERKHSTQRDEIKLYMDKSFQSSIGYFAAILAFLALSKTSFSSDMAVSFSIGTISLLSIVILLTNWAYLRLSAVSSG